MKNETYNGFKNYETWNIALWLANDEGLNDLAYRYRFRGYRALAEALSEIMPETPDGVPWTDPDLDIDELDDIIMENG